MAKTNTKRRQQSESIFEGDDIFQHFADRGRPLTNDEPIEKKGSADVDALVAKIDALSSTVDTLTEANRRMTMAPAAPAGAGQHQFTAEDVKLDLTGMPDPLTDAAAYSAELQTRVGSFVAARETVIRQDVSQKANRQQDADRLWKGFVEKNPEWEAYPELVEATAVRLAQDAIRGGLDPQKYMFQNTAVFYGDVAKQLTERYGNLIQDEGDESPPANDPLARQSSRPRRDEGGRFSRGESNDDDGRTGGIFGGNESGGRPAGRGRGAEGGSDMITDLHAIQRKMGLF